MLGHQEYQPELFTSIDMESLVPKNHLLRKIDRVLDLGFVRELAKEFYCADNGRPSIDPELFVRMLLIEYFYNIESDRQLCEEIGFNIWQVAWDDEPNEQGLYLPALYKEESGEEFFRQ